MTERKSRKSVVQNSQVKDPIPWTKAKELCVETAKDDKVMALIFAVGFYSGLRLSDILSVRKTDIVKHEFKIKATKTGKFEIRPLPHGFYTLLKRCGITIQSLPTGNLFPSKKNPKKPPLDQTIIAAIQRYAEKIGLTENYDIGTHTLRKTFCRRLYDISSNKTDALQCISKMIKHDDLSTTLDYIGVYKEEAYSLINDIDEEAHFTPSDNLIIEALEKKFESFNEKADLILEMLSEKKKNIVCPNCQNPHPHLYGDNGGHCEECGYK